jgi:hypothetical protein
MAFSLRAPILVALVLILSAPAAWAGAPEALHAEEGELAGLDVGLLFIDLVGWENTGPGQHRLQVLDAPLLTGALHVASGETSETHVMDFPLLRAVEIDNYGPEDKETRILQAPFITGWRHGKDGGERSWELLDVLGIKALGHKRSPDSWAWSLLDGSLVTGFHAENDPAHFESELLGLDILDLSLIEADRDPGGHSWSLLDSDGLVPFTLLSNQRGADGSGEFTLLDPPALRPLFRLQQRGNMAEADFLFLFHTEYER